MRRILAYCLVLLAFICACSCKKGPVVIPKGDLAKIYAEMSMADECIGAQSRFRRVADTSRVYAPIFAKYGYTVEDFHASEEKYIKDAGRYARIIKKSVRILEAENKVLVKERDRLESVRRRLEARLRFRPHKIFLLDTLNEEYMKDSLFNFDFQLGLDTVFAGPRLIVSSDTLARDSVKLTLAQEPLDDTVEKDVANVNTTVPAVDIEKKKPGLKIGEKIKAAASATF